MLVKVRAMDWGHFGGVGERWEEVITESTSFFRKMCHYDIALV